jgi:transcriptional regulator GlxA family with amidase domain
MMPAMTHALHARRIVLVAFPGVQPIDLVGPAEVFSEAAARTKDAYRVEVVARDPGPIATRGGYAIAPARTIDAVRGSVDALLVAGGPGVREAEHDAELVAWLKAAATRARRVASVCSGAFLLAAAGLLDGRRAATHWDGCEELARRYPTVAVESDPIFVRDGHVWTSAGASAGMDLALAMVEEDLGRDVALAVARWLVIFLQRPGGQAQFSVQLATQAADRAPLRELQAWIAEHLDEDLRVEVLAERAYMSQRHFARAFRDEIGVTPAAYVEAVRLERARQRLEDGAETIEQIARQCGFGTPETMRRAFARRVGVSPASYRARFHRAA